MKRIVLSIVGAVVLVSGCGSGAKTTYDPLLEMAEQGDSFAQYFLASRYGLGDGYQKDDKKAVYWYTKAAETGRPDAQRDLGVCYRDGLGVSRNFERSTFWFTKAAEQGLPEAQYDLAVCYDKGEGVTKDPAKAFQWFLKAAEQGDARGQYQVSWHYMTLYGADRPADTTEKAYTWARIASLSGHSNDVQIDPSSLTAEQRRKCEAEANKRSEEFGKRKMEQKGRYQAEQSVLFKELGNRARKAVSEGRQLYKGK